MNKKIIYQTGFANHFATEVIAGTLPQGQNSPQHVAHGLYAEQLSGTAFTCSRHENYRSWLYRIRPSVCHSRFSVYEHPINQERSHSAKATPPDQMRWDPLPLPIEKTDFIDGLHSFAIGGDYPKQNSTGIYLYTCNNSMNSRYFYNADGEWLIVPQLGELLFHTEFGRLAIKPGEICVIPRGVKFTVECQGEARGYICENTGKLFRLPDLGPIGANGLANPRDFLTPVAYFEEREGDFQLLCKFDGTVWQADIKHSPIDVVAWHGNYAPYKYDLHCFNTINTVSFDHPDPSIFTVLTAPSPTPGVANVDFVIFPSRWMVAEHTFRAPYYHRNIMNEFMGLIYGNYDAKRTGFEPGGCSLHNCMSAHGPDEQAFVAASNADLQPDYYHATLAFMFESCHLWRLNESALYSPSRQQDYQQCWQTLSKKFKRS